MEVIGRPLAGAIAADADRRFRLSEHHGVAFQFDVVDAEQDDGITVVSLVLFVALYSMKAKCSRNN